jgi:hypothetical protein
MTQAATHTTIRFTIALFALAICSFFVADPAAGQFTTEWEKSENEGNRPTYVSDGGYTARGLAYGVVDDGNGNMVERVFVASNENGTYRIYVVNPTDGALLDSLDVSGIKEDGSRFLNDVGVSEDGLIIACNAARGDFGLAQPFHCYRWDDLTAAPTQIIDGAAMEERVGSNISVTGAASDNSLLIHTAAVASNNDLGDALYRFSTDDNGSSFMTDTLFTSAEGATPNVEDAYPAPGGGYYHTWVNEPAQQYDASENETGQIPTGVADSLVSLTIFEAEGETFLAGAKNHYAGGTPQGADSRVRVANITNGADNATMYGQTSDLGDTEQFQGNGDVDVRVNDDATATFFFLSTNNGIAAFTADEGPFAPDPITIDGQATESQYTKMAQADTANGFGDAASLEALYYYVDEPNQNLYVATAGTLETQEAFGALNRHGIWVNVTGGDSSPDGKPAGEALGIGASSDPDTYITASEGDYKADFEVDFMTSVGPTFNAPASEVDALIGDHTGSSPSLVEFEETDQSGSVATDEAGAGIEYAYLNQDTDSTGAEWKIPFDAIGASSANDIEVFAFLVNNGGYFSNEIIPGNGAKFIGENISGNNDNNVGTNPDWEDLASQFNDTYHTSPIALPVELASFSARRDGKSAVLSWKTAAETGNAGFAVEHAVGPEGAFQQVGWVEGVGTTTEAQSYRYAVEDLSAGTHRFRLKQEDLDGSASLSKVVEVDVRPDGPIAIEQVAPNPVTQTSTLRFTPRESGAVTVGLYDVLGRRVKTLHEGRVSGGQSQQVTLDASALSSGVYFLRVKGEGFSKTRRVTIVQ